MKISPNFTHSVTRFCPIVIGIVVLFVPQISETWIKSLLSFFSCYVYPFIKGWLDEKKLNKEADKILEIQHKSIHPIKSIDCSERGIKIQFDTLPKANDEYNKENPTAPCPPAAAEPLSTG